MITTIVILSIALVVVLAYAIVSTDVQQFVKYLNQTEGERDEISSSLTLIKENLSELKEKLPPVLLLENRTPIVKSFTFTVANICNDARDITIALLPSYFTVPGEILHRNTPVDVIITDGVMKTTTGKEVKANGKPGLIGDFIKFIRSNRIRVTGIKLKVDDSEQFGSEIIIINHNPLEIISGKVILPENYENSMQNNDKIVEIPHDFTIDGTTSITTVIKAGRIITYVFFYTY